MDTWLVGAGFVVPLTVALAWAIWYLVALGRKQRQHASTSHVYRGQGEAVTVAELLEEAAERGEGIRLHWSVDDEAQAGRRWPGMRPYVQDQVGTDFMRPVNDKSSEWPTEVLPKVGDFGDDDEP